MDRQHDAQQTEEGFIETGKADEDPPPFVLGIDRQRHKKPEQALRLVGADRVVRNLPPSMGAEDFSFMLQARPGAYLRLGQGGADEGRFLHNTQYDFNDDVLPIGAALFVALAEKTLRR